VVDHPVSGIVTTEVWPARLFTFLLALIVPVWVSVPSSRMILKAVALVNSTRKVSSARLPAELTVIGIEVFQTPEAFSLLITWTSEHQPVLWKRISRGRV